MKTNLNNSNSKGRIRRRSAAILILCAWLIANTASVNAATSSYYHNEKAVNCMAFIRPQLALSSMKLDKDADFSIDAKLSGIVMDAEGVPIHHFWTTGRNKCAVAVRGFKNAQQILTAYYVNGERKGILGTSTRG